jgi:hypothetical protein
MSHPVQCPCGSTIAFQSGPGRSDRPSSLSTHVLCGGCQRRVARQIERRFGRHRYGGHFADRVHDFIQDCYQRQLLTDGGLKSFVPPSDTEARSPAFHGWLRVVVGNFCNVTYKRIRLEIEAHVAPVARGDLPGPLPSMNPEQAFNQQYWLSLCENGLEKVRKNWQHKGPTKGKRFDAILRSLTFGTDSLHAVAAQLGVTKGHLGVLIHELRRDVKHAVEAEVRDTLDFPPGLEGPGIQRLVDAEIRALMDSLRAPEANHQNDLYE